MGAFLPFEGAAWVWAFGTSPSSSDVFRNATERPSVRRALPEKKPGSEVDTTGQDLMARYGNMAAVSD